MQSSVLLLLLKSSELGELRRAETHPILAGVMMDVAILLPSSGAARAARLLKRAARV